MTLIFELLDLDRVKLKQPAKYLCQRSFSSKFIVRTQRHTNRHSHVRTDYREGPITCRPSRPHLPVIYTSGNVNPPRHSYGIVPAAAAAALAAALVAERNLFLSPPALHRVVMTHYLYSPGTCLSLSISHTPSLSVCLSSRMTASSLFLCACLLLHD